ncbi:MAG: o-succinylbenzoate synthase [Thaumarchaeota archaeon]|nr:o-succinylbenzoate synthase [Nitrososphaerota archaeon]
MSLKVTLVRLPLLDPFSSSYGTESRRNALILELDGGDGIEAVSECTTDEDLRYGHEDNSIALHLIKDFLGEAVKGERPPAPEEFVGRVNRIRDHQMSKASVEMLLWDYRAKSDGRPLAEAMGRPRGYAEAGVSLGIAKTEVMVDRIGAALDRGYKRVKVKIEKGRGHEILKAARDRFPEAPLSADANGCFDIQKDLAELRRIDRFDLQYLEQPLGFDDILDHAELAKKVSTPICLDESITTTERARQALEIGAASVINVKPGRVGGISAAMEIARTTRKERCHAWVGGMLETGVGRAFNVALASQELFDYPGDTSPNDRYWERDIVRNPFVMEAGRISPNAGPGAGVELDRAFLAKATVKSWKIF